MQHRRKIHAYQQLARSLRCLALTWLVVCPLLIGMTPAVAQIDSGSQKGFMIESQPSGATVTIEGEIIGKTPCTFPYQLSGRYRLYAEKKGYETVSREIDFGARKTETITFILPPKTRGKAVLRSAVMTGWGQSYTEQKIKSRTFLAMQGLSLATAAIMHERCNHYKGVYEDELIAYEKASYILENEPKAWQNLQRAHDRWANTDSWRRSMLYFSAGLHVVNILDALFVFPKNLRQIEILAAPVQAAPNGSGFTISYSIPL